MRLNQSFSVRLANGAERAFVTAEEMVIWIEQQRGTVAERLQRLIYI